MEGTQRRFLACLTALTLIVIAVQGWSGMTELALYATPLFLLVGLLLCGRYVAEDRIVRHWLARAPVRRRRRPSVRRWPIADTPLVSTLERGPHLERGPPALAALA